MLFLYVSAQNYPGGHALNQLHDLLRAQTFAGPHTAHMPLAMAGVAASSSTGDGLVTVPGPADASTVVHFDGVEGPLRHVHVHIANGAAMTGVSRFGEAFHTRLERQTGIAALDPALDPALNPWTPFPTASVAEAGKRVGATQRVMWHYWKNETLTTPSDFAVFTHVLSETAELEGHGFRLLATVEGFKRIDFRGLRVVTEPAVYVFEAKV